MQSVGVLLDVAVPDGARVVRDEVVRVLTAGEEVVVGSGHPPSKTGKPGMQAALVVVGAAPVVLERSDVVLAASVDEEEREEVVGTGQPPRRTGRPGMQAGLEVGAAVVVVRELGSTRMSQDAAP